MKQPFMIDIADQGLRLDACLGQLYFHYEQLLLTMLAVAGTDALVAAVYVISQVAAVVTPDEKPIFVPAVVNERSPVKRMAEPMPAAVAAG